MSRSRIYPWFLVGMLWVVALLNYMDRQMLSTMKPSMMADIAELESATNFGRLMAVFLWIYGAMSPVAGLIADRTSRKWLIVISLLIWSGITFSMGHANSFSQLYWLRAIMGISEALYLPAGLSLITDFHGDRTRSLAVGIHMTGIYAGQALGGFGATIAHTFSWQTAFQFFGMTGIVYAFVLAIFLRDKTGEDPVGSNVKTDKMPSLAGSLGMLLGNISFWVILFYFLVPSLPGWAVKNWLPTLFSENLGIEMAQAGPLSTITIAVSSLLGVIIGGILSDRWVRKNLRGRIFTSAIGLGLTIPSLVLIGMGNTIFTSISAAACFGIGFGMFDANNMPILCQFVSKRFRATAYGLMNMAGVFAGAYITNRLGKSTDAGNLGRDFMFLGAMVMVALVVQVIVLRPKANDFTDSKPLT